MSTSNTSAVTRRRQSWPVDLAIGLAAVGAAGSVGPAVHADVYVSYLPSIRNGTISASSAAGEPQETGYDAPPFTYEPLAFDQCVQVGGSKACIDSQSSWPVLPGTQTIAFVADGSLLATKGPGAGFAICNEALYVDMLIAGLGEGELATIKFAGSLAENQGSGIVSLVGPGVNLAYDANATWNHALSLGNGIYAITVQSGAVLVANSGVQTVSYNVIFQLASNPQCGSWDAGNCFLTHGPGCASAACCASVCTADPFCCNVAWDSICVQGAVAACAPSAATEGLIDPRTGHRHHLISPAPWPTAQEVAAADGANLVAIDNAAENGWLLDNLLNNVDAFPRSTWIGLSDIDGDEVFGWASGVPVTYLNFGPGEPAGQDGAAFVLMDDISGTWSTAGGAGFEAWSVAEQSRPECGSGADSCFEAYAGHSLGCDIESCCNVVCERDGFCCVVQWDLLCLEEAQEFCAPQVIAGPIPNPVTGHSYYLVGLTAWSEAERWALERGGRLATIDDALENAWIWHNLQGYGGVDRAPYIGLHDQLVDGVFQWSSHAPANYLNWAPGGRGGFPDEDYAFMTASGTWDVDPIGDRDFEHHAIIELPCVADLGGDGAVDGADLGALLGAWGLGDSPADIDGNGLVDGSDLGLLLGAWGPCAASTCCAASGAPGCDQPGCTSCVCEQWPHCCEIQWDAPCVEHAASGCAAACACGL